MKIKCEEKGCGMTYIIFDETFEPVKCSLCGSEKIIVNTEVEL